MSLPKGKAATDYFLESLGRLTDRNGPLQKTLRQLRDIASRQDVDLPEDVDDCLRSVNRDLSAVQVGSRRVVGQIEELRGLVHISALITSSLDVNQVLEEVMDTAITLTNAERAYLVLREGKDNELVLRAARNWDKESISDSDVTFSRGIIESAIETGEPILTINAQGDSRFQGNESVLVHDLRSIVCIPLTLRGRVLGVLYADHRSVQGIFDESSVQLLSAFANQAAIAIENAQHFTRVKKDLDHAKREVHRLRIEINEKKLDKELTEITESDFFQRISSMASKMRERQK